MPTDPARGHRGQKPTATPRRSGQATQASALYADAFGRDPQFAQFYRQPGGLPRHLPQQVRHHGAGPGSEFFRSCATVEVLPARRQRLPKTLTGHDMSGLAVQGDA